MCIIFSHIIYYIIKVGLRNCGCAKWLHQIAKILLDLKKKKRKIYIVRTNFGLDLKYDWILAQ